ncbi:MAG: DoxX family membrane protein [Proteobacteria bacterium]|nr:DoxX family membrane protein [Pseudomonadota bacterium]
MIATICRSIAALIFIGAGVLHFLNPEPFVLIVPPYLPAPELLVAISGVFEVLGGVGLLIPRTRVAAGWGLIALLIAVYPANVHMLVNEVYLPDMPQEKWLLWVRMPVQFVFAALVIVGAGIWPRSDGDDG